MEQQTYENVFVARQPIFDRKKNVWGFELLYRHSGNADTAVFSEENEATFKVMTSLSLCPGPDNACSRIMITFPEESIMIHSPYALPAENTIIKLRESFSAQPFFLEALRDLKDSGYLVAVTGYQARSGRRTLCQAADILSIDLNDPEQENIQLFAASAKEHDAILMAAKIEDHKAFDLALEMGCTLFQGFFFKRPVLLSGRKITSTDAARLKLFRIIEDLDPNFDQVARAIESDVSISYRLLAFLNSPAFGFTRPIDSIKQAVVLLGWKKLRNWIRLIILTDMPSPDKTRELSFLSAQRAKFLEMLAVETDRLDMADSLFLLGLFSLLEALLDMDMREIVPHLPLADELKGALCGEDNQYLPWLQLTDSVEELEWERLERSMAALGLDQVGVEQAYQEAIKWANAFFASC